ncbi:hypothetical protein Kisp02_32040 [Kineosporia sp. NBRC 101731]|nr:hypothetical protein Kisp02_32040 [Kineosporia sp. NBRC 101731]
MTSRPARADDNRLDVVDLPAPMLPATKTRFDVWMSASTPHPPRSAARRPIVGITASFIMYRRGQGRVPRARLSSGSQAVQENAQEAIGPGGVLR